MSKDVDTDDVRDLESPEDGGAEVAGLDEERPNAADEAIQEELVRLQQEVEKLRELYLRKLADFENFRKRQEREVEDFRRFANAGLVKDCLPVLDNLERALAASTGSGSGLREGVELVLKQFREVLTRHGVIEIDPLGQAFDPTVHEAIARQERGDVTEPTVVSVLQKGYLLGERLVRPALVIVAVPTSGGGDEAGSPDLEEG